MAKKAIYILIIQIFFIPLTGINVANAQILPRIPFIQFSTPSPTMQPTDTPEPTSTPPFTSTPTPNGTSVATSTPRPTTTPSPSPTASNITPSPSPDSSPASSETPVPVQTTLPPTNSQTPTPIVQGIIDDDQPPGNRTVNILGLIEPLTRPFKENYYTEYGLDKSVSKTLIIASLLSIGVGVMLLIKPIYRNITSSYVRVNNFYRSLIGSDGVKLSTSQ